MCANKKKVWIICPFNNVAYIFMDIYELFKDEWDPLFVFLFKDTFSERLLADAGLRTYTIDYWEIMKNNKLKREYLFLREADKLIRQEGLPEISFNQEMPTIFSKYIMKRMKDKKKLRLFYAWGYLPDNYDYSKVKFTIKNFMYRLIFKSIGYPMGAYFPVDSDIILVRSELFKKLVERHTEPGTDIRTVGYWLKNKLDCLKSAEVQIEMQRRFIDKFGMPDRKIISFLTQPLLDKAQFGRYRELLPRLLDKLGKYSKDCNIVMKMHPRDKRELYEVIVKEYPYIKLLNWSDFNTFELISASDVVLGYCSTTLMDAVYMGKSVYSFDIEDNDKKDRYYKELPLINPDREIDLFGDYEISHELKAHLSSIIPMVNFRDALSNVIGEGKQHAGKDI